MSLAGEDAVAWKRRIDEGKRLDEGKVLRSLTGSGHDVQRGEIIADDQSPQFAGWVVAGWSWSESKVFLAYDNALMAVRPFVLDMQLREDDFNFE